VSKYDAGDGVQCPVYEIRSALTVCAFHCTGNRLVLTSLGAKRVAPTVCSAPEYHQFDFWLGDWDPFEFSRSTRDAHVRINRILDGCVIHVDDQSVDGHKGES
jgi:hypothetical protein